MLQNYELLLLIYLRDPTVQKLSTPKQLFQYFCKPFGSDAEKVANTCSQYFSDSNGKTLMLLIDGYDEMPEELRGNSLIDDILNCQVLPDCGLVISSRPFASVLLREQATIRVDMLGFTKKQRTHYIQHLFSDKSQIKQITTYLDQHIVINSLCYLPFNLSLLLFLCKQGVSLPKNATKLYNIFICLMMHQSLSKFGTSSKQTITDINNLPEPYGQFIKQLSKFSLQALNSNQLIFTLNEIKQFCPQVESIPGALNAFGLLQAIEHVSIFQTTTTLSFLHLSIQEFLAANYITTLKPDEELYILKKYFWSENHSNMFTFYLTLTKGQRSSFKQLVCAGDNNVVVHSKFLNDRFKLLHLYRCLNEVSGNDHVRRTIERRFSDGIMYFFNTMLSTNDIENISIFLTCSYIKQWKVLNLGSCYIQDAGVRMLHRMITSNSSSIIINELWLHDNGLTSSSDECLADIVFACGVRVLVINYNVAIGQTEKFFPKILSLVHILRISGVNLTSREAIIIFTLLKEKKAKLKELCMADNDITDDACVVIAEALQVNNTLEYLDICGNDISRVASQIILNSLRHNNTLANLQLTVQDDYIYVTQILSLQDIVNEERRRRRCQVKFNVGFTSLF